MFIYLLLQLILRDKKEMNIKIAQYSENKIARVVVHQIIVRN